MAQKRPLPSASAQRQPQQPLSLLQQQTRKTRLLQKSARAIEEVAGGRKVRARACLSRVPSLSGERVSSSSDVDVALQFRVQSCHIVALADKLRN